MKIVGQIARRTQKPLGKGEIGLKVGKTINRCRAGKHFKFWCRNRCGHGSCWQRTQ